MLDIIFFSRRSNHGKYFKKVSEFVTLSTEVHIMGNVYLPALNFIKEGLAFSTKTLVADQLVRKQASNPQLFKFNIVKTIYTCLISFIEKLRYMKYLALLSSNRPRNIALWNGQKLPNITVVKAAQNLNISIIYFENGLLPNTTTIDFNGVNAKSSLPRDIDFYKKQDIGNHYLRTSLIARPLNKQRQKEKEITIPNKYIFLPFQVPNDTQIVVNSSWIKSIEKLLSEVVTAVNKLGDINLYIVVKEHPSWKFSYSALHNRHQNVVFANSNNTEQLIKEAQAVVTINSTVGLEAVLLKKKVITLGSACYNIEGLVQHVTDSDELLNALRNIGQWQIDQLLQQRFISFLQEVYTIPTRWSMADKIHLNAVESRLSKQDAFSRLL